MVADKKKRTGQAKEAEPETQGQTTGGSSAGNQTSGTGQQGQTLTGSSATDEPQTAQPQEQGTTDGSTAKRKPWIRKTPVEHILEQVARQEKRVADLKAELAKEETALNTMREATKSLGGS